MSIRISINRLRLIGLFLFFIQAACTQEKPTGSFTTTPPHVSPSKDESPLSTGESSLSEDEIMKMIDAIKLPGYMAQSKKYRRRAEITSKNLPTIQDWFKQIFKGEEDVHARKQLEGKEDLITVSPLLAVLPYDIDIRLIQALVSQGANVNKKEEVTTKLKMSPLRAAFIYASPHVIKWLLNNEADLKTGHYNKYPAAFLLIDFLNQNPNKNYEIAALLVRKLQADQMIQKNQNKNTVLHQFLYDEQRLKRNHSRTSKRVAIWIQLLGECANEFKQCFDEHNRLNQTPLDLARHHKIQKAVKEAIEKAAGVKLMSTKEPRAMPQMNDEEAYERVMQMTDGKGF